MNKLRKIFILLFGIMASVQVMAQDKIVPRYPSAPLPSPLRS